MLYSGLSVTFVGKGNPAVLPLAAQEALVTEVLGPCDFAVSGRMLTGPDLDTQFQTLETATATWTRRSPPRVRWSTQVDRLEGDWFADHSHSRLSLEELPTHDAALALYEAFRLALRPHGYRPLLYGRSALEKALRAAGDTEGLARWQAARVASLLDPEPLTPPLEAVLSADALDAELLATLLEQFPHPEGVRVLDLQHNHLSTLPPVLRRFQQVQRLSLEHNAFFEGPTPQTLQSLFPKLRTVELQGCTLQPGVVEALRAAGYTVFL